jgi:hypothetical protein
MIYTTISDQTLLDTEKQVPEASEASEKKNHSIEEKNQKVAEGLDFLLRHFFEPLFPRKVSADTTGGQQWRADDKLRALSLFEGAFRKNSRINAFRIGQTNPDLIFIDLDLEDFGCSKAALKRALTNTLKTINRKLLGGHPTVLWSGNGYHIIQPIQCDIALEDIPELHKLEPET